MLWSLLILDAIKILKEACGDPPEARKKKHDRQRQELSNCFNVVFQLFCYIIFMIFMYAYYLYTRYPIVARPLGLVFSADRGGGGRSHAGVSKEN